MSGPDQPGNPNPYQQQPMGPVTTKFARIDPGPSQTFGILGALISVVGAVLVVVSFTVADWFSASHTGVSDIRSAITALGDSAFSAPARVYFGWLGWVLFAVAIVAALIAAVPTVGSAFRVIAPLVAAVAIVLTFLAIRLGSSTLADFGGASYGEYLKNARIGFYLALAGFLLIGIGGAIGPHHKRG